MKKSDKIALRQKSSSELVSLLSAKSKELVELKAKQYTGSQKDTSVFKKVRYEISLINSLLATTKNDTK